MKNKNSTLFDEENKENSDHFSLEQEKNNKASSEIVATYSQNTEENKDNQPSFLVNLFTKYIPNFFASPNFRYALTRLLTGIITLLLICGVVFMLLRLIPKEGYYDRGTLQKLTTEALKQSYKDKIDHQFGFDKPKFVQLIQFYWDILPIPRSYISGYKFTDSTFSTLVPKGSVIKWVYLGRSLVGLSGQFTTDILKDRIPLSFSITIISTVISYVLAYPLGVWMAHHKGKWQDKLGNGFIVLNFAIPGLVFYLVLKNVFGAINGQLFLQYDMMHPVVSLIPAVFSLTFLSIPGTSMWVRRFMVDEGDSDYVKFARAKGLSERRIMYTHVLRNAVVPLVRNFPAAFIGAIVGSYFVEQVWVIPGTGKLLIKAMNPSQPDNGLVQGLVLVYAAMSMISYILGDICTMIVDPRIKLGKK